MRRTDGGHGRMAPNAFAGWWLLSYGPCSLSCLGSAEQTR